MKKLITLFFFGIFSIACLAETDGQKICASAVKGLKKTSRAYAEARCDDVSVGQAYCMEGVFLKDKSTSIAYAAARCDGVKGISKGICVRDKIANGKSIAYAIATCN